MWKTTTWQPAIVARLPVEGWPAPAWLIVVWLIVAWLAAALPASSQAAEAGAAASEAPAAVPAPVADLAALVSATLASNPRVQVADAALAAAAARARGADRPIYNPELEADFERTDVSTSSIGLSQAIDWSDKRAAMGGIADAEVEAQRAERAAVRQALATELLSSLAGFHTQRGLERLAEQRTALTQQFLSLTERRHQAGDLPQVEVDMARLAAVDARIRKARATAARVQATQSLVALTGGNLPAWPSLPDEVPALEGQDVDPEMDLLRLPALRAQQARIIAAKQAIRLKRRESRPDPTIGLRGGREDSEGLVGVSFSIPLFVRNDFKAEVEAAGEDAVARGSELQDMARLARSRLVSTAERYRLTRDAWLEWRKAGEFSLQRQTELLQRLWQAGELSTTDYLVQLGQSTDTQASVVELQGDLWQAWVDWLAASGQVESWLGLDDHVAPGAP